MIVNIYEEENFEIMSKKRHFDPDFWDLPVFLQNKKKIASIKIFFDLNNVEN